MLFPCLGTVVLAHSGSTFGFPEIRRGALLGIVSAAARERLGIGVCDRLLCTADVVDAGAARQLGLVDFIGSWREIEITLVSLTAPMRTSDALEEGTIRSPGHTPRLGTLQVEADEARQVMRLVVNADQSGGVNACAAASVLQLLRSVPPLRVLWFHIEGSWGEPKRLGIGTMEDHVHVRASISELSHRGIIVMSTLRGHVYGSLLRLSLSTHYRILGDDVTLSCQQMDALQLHQALHPEDAAAFLREGSVNAGRAAELGLASEVVVGREQEHALQLSSWLAAQSPVGVKHVMRLSSHQSHSALVAAEQMHKSTSAHISTQPPVTNKLTLWSGGVAFRVAAIAGAQVKATLAMTASDACERELLVHLSKPGSPLNLSVVGHKRIPPVILERVVEMSVEAAALNFRDVLNVLGLDPTGQVLDPLL